MITSTSHGQRRQFFYSSLLSELAAAKEIRLFDLGGFLRGRMLGELRTVQEAGQQVGRRVLATDSALAVLCGLVTAGGLWWAVLAVAARELTIGDLTMFVAALAAVAGTLTTIITNAAMVYQAMLMFRCYQDVLIEAPDLELAADPLPAQPLRRGIDLQDVWFRYGPDTPWILRGVSCFIPHGQVVALVGHNGAWQEHAGQALVSALRPGPRPDLVGRIESVRHRPGRPARPDQRGIPGLHEVRLERCRQHSRRRPGHGGP
jgi:ATP-binding cassette, subfamily B, bacterial